MLRPSLVDGCASTKRGRGMLGEGGSRMAVGPAPPGLSPQKARSRWNDFGAWRPACMCGLPDATIRLAWWLVCRSSLIRTIPSAPESHRCPPLCGSLARQVCACITIGREFHPAPKIYMLLSAW